MSKRTTREVKLTTGGSSLKLPPATKLPVRDKGEHDPGHGVPARIRGPQARLSVAVRPAVCQLGILPGESHHRLRTTTAPRSTCGSEHEIVVCWLEVTLWSSPNDKCLAARRGWLERS
jgi:hypothetical protein